jgi:hypothetical protein
MMIPIRIMPICLQTGLPRVFGRLILLYSPYSPAGPDLPGLAVGMVMAPRETGLGLICFVLDTP